MSSKTRPCTCGECDFCIKQMHNDEIRARNESYMTAAQLEMRELAGVRY